MLDTYFILLMNEALSKHKWQLALMFLDDFVVSSWSVSENKGHAEHVLTRLHVAKATLKFR